LKNQNSAKINKKAERSDPPDNFPVFIRRMTAGQCCCCTESAQRLATLLYPDRLVDLILALFLQTSSDFEQKLAIPQLDSESSSSILDVLRRAAMSERIGELHASACRYRSCGTWRGPATF